MILGRVNSRLGAEVAISVLDANGQVHPITTVVDTGFNGHLTLRSADIASFGLRRTGAVRVRLADGSISFRRYFGARIQWDGAVRTVTALQVEADSLLGMLVLSGSRLTIDAVPGGEVSIGPIP
jgi:predicted aspartyl protease